ncbi:uncharacterized [Tachysurus ichikawai]
MIHRSHPSQMVWTVPSASRSRSLSVTSADLRILALIRLIESLAFLFRQLLLSFFLQRAAVILPTCSGAFRICRGYSRNRALFQSKRRCREDLTADGSSVTAFCVSLSARSEPNADDGVLSLDSF